MLAGLLRGPRHGACRFACLCGPLSSMYAVLSLFVSVADGRTSLLTGGDHCHLTLINPDEAKISPARPPATPNALTGQRSRFAAFDGTLASVRKPGCPQPFVDAHFFAAWRAVSQCGAILLISRRNDGSQENASLLAAGLSSQAVAT